MAPDGLDTVLISGLGLSAFGLAFLAHRKTSGKPGTATAAASKRPSCPPGFLPVMHADALFHATGVKPLLAQIQQSLGFAPENHDRDVQPLLEQVAEFVQLLPASESHHHANPGGLLTHVLEVATIALLRCEGAKLPMGRPTEEQLKHAARWRYGVLVAAILHDIGKPLADVLVDVIGSRGDTTLWNGLGGNLGDYGHAYLVRFPLRKDYQAHQRLPVMLLKSMVPATTIRWLSDDPELVPVLIAYLAGESAGGPISELVKEADRRSVAENLLKGNRTRFATARQVPLIERLMDGMRRMLAAGELPLNREGATGFCDREDLWCVAGPIAEKVRAYLDQQEVRETGAAGLPTDNSRLFDVWLDYGAVRPNAGAAIWRAKITLDKPEGGDWTQTFTMLRFPLEKLYACPEDYPKPLPGRIEVVPGLPPTSAAVTQRPPSIEAVAQPVRTPEAVSAASSTETGGKAGLALNRCPEAGAPNVGMAGAADDDLVAVAMDFDVPAPSNEPQLAPPAQAIQLSATPIDEYLSADESAQSALAPAGNTVPGPSLVAVEPTAPMVPAQANIHAGVKFFWLKRFG